MRHVAEPNLIQILKSNHLKRNRTPNSTGAKLELP